jgi:hypothetical protein
MTETKLNEPELADSREVFAGYFYVVDGEVVRLNYGTTMHQKVTVGDYKAAKDIKSFTLCDIDGRGIRDIAKR